VPTGSPRLPGPPAAVSPAEFTLAGRDVWLVDANNLIFQVFHAIPEMTSPQGRPVNAVYGFTRDLFYLIEEKQPDLLICVFDGPEKTFRHEFFTDYKANRGEMPEDLAPQFAEIDRVLRGFGVPRLASSGFEADDLLATLAAQIDHEGGQCTLVTGDKDCRQLITDRVTIYNVRKDQMYGAAELEEQWGIRPDQVVDFQSLVGDSVDNVPGVPLIGPKLARELLLQYETLDAVLDHADEVKGKKRSENLKTYRDQALLSRRLVRLRDDVPIDFNWPDGRVGGLDIAELASLFREYGFRTFSEKVQSMEVASAPGKWTADYITVDTPAAFEALLFELARQASFSFDTETTSLTPTRAELVGLSFAWEEGRAFYVPVRAPAGERHLKLADVLMGLRPILENPAIGKTGQNLKYDVVVLKTAGIDVRGVSFDTMVASYLLEAGQRNHNLDELAKRHLDHTTTKISELIGTGKNQKRMDEVTVAAVSPYACEDADVALRLVPILAERLDAEELTDLFEQVEMPLVEVLSELEHNGIRLDVGRLAALSREFGERIDATRAEIYKLAGRELNIDSPKQLREVLFEELGLPVVRRSKTGPSTDAAVLEELAAHHALPAKIVEYRQFAKLKNTYVDALPELVNPRTGRVHASFNQTIAATGRLSSSDPNLQNIPIRTESGRAIRSAFLPAEEGWKLLAADYSQIELRVLAHFSKDESLCAAFARDEDIHASVAAQVYDVAVEDVTSEQRRQAKAVNFGVVYGQSPFGLAKQLGIPQEEAAEFIDAYFERHPGVEQFMEQILASCHESGYVKTILGRRRMIQGVRSGVGRQRNLSERTAINTVIQGSAADLIKLAMLAVHRRLHDANSNAAMILQIHDELVFDVPAEQLDDLTKMVSDEMSNVLSLDVPLKVDVKSGDDWGEV
jgi:DNA polymerase-1